MKIPENHQTVMPYLILHEAGKFSTFVQRVFQATETFRRMRDNTNTIMHAEIRIGQSTLMFAEATGQWRQQPAGLFIYVEDADEVYRNALSEGASAIMEPADQDYGRSCGISDPAGNTWWITSIVK